MQKILLIDGHSIAMRSHYGMIKEEGGRRAKDGTPINVCAGFLATLAKIISLRKPDAIAIAFDSPEKTYRHNIYPGYKAGRQDKPEGFNVDFDNLKRILISSDFPVFILPGVEGDDIIATVTKQCVSSEYFVEILTSDKDFYQLIDIDDLVIILTPKGELVTADHVFWKTGVKVCRFNDYKILMGDPSDNIPGIKGIGEKTAVELIEQYGTISEIYNNLDQLKPGIRTKLELGRADLGLMRDLVEMRKDIPITLNLAGCGINHLKLDNSIRDCERLNLRQQHESLCKAISYLNSNVNN